MSPFYSANYKLSNLILKQFSKTVSTFIVTH